MPVATRIAGAPDVLSAEVLSAVVRGQPVYATAASKFDLADATGALTQLVVGLAARDAAASTVLVVQTEGKVVRADWTAVAGAVGLSPGARYFLSTTPGGITAIAPSGAGEYVRAVGKAISPTTLDIEIDQSILLS